MDWRCKTLVLELVCTEWVGEVSGCMEEVEEEEEMAMVEVEEVVEEVED